MTAIVGIYCKDGVVIGADSSATFTDGNTRTIEQSTEKILIVKDQVIVAGTGAVGLGQRFSTVVERAWSERAFTKPRMEAAKFLSHHMIKDMSETFVKQGAYGALVAYPCEKKPTLCEFAITDFQPELKHEKMWFCTMGCTQGMTDPFLGLMKDVFWKEGIPSLSEGIFVTLWALEHAILLNPGGVNAPVNIAVLEVREGKTAARLLSDTELDEHRQNIEDAKDALRNYRERQISTVPVEIGVDESDLPAPAPPVETPVKVEKK